MTPQGDDDMQHRRALHGKKNGPATSRAQRAAAATTRRLTLLGLRGSVDEDDGSGPVAPSG